MGENLGELKPAATVPAEVLGSCLAPPPSVNITEASTV